MLQPLPQDWKHFYDSIGTGASFGLFELPNRGVQPVLLIHALPEMRIPGEVVFFYDLQLLVCGDVHVVRFLIEVQGRAGQMNEDQLSFSVYDQPKRSVWQLSLMTAGKGLRFDTFLNPTDQEDRLILGQLEVVPVLSVSMVQSGSFCWGKRLVWRDQTRQARDIAAIERLLQPDSTYPPQMAALWIVYLERADDDEERRCIGTISGNTAGKALENASVFYEYPSHDLVVERLLDMVKAVLDKLNSSIGDAEKCYEQQRIAKSELGPLGLYVYFDPSANGARGEYKVAFLDDL